MKIFTVQEYRLLLLGFQEKQRSKKATRENDEPSKTGESTQGTFEHCFDESYLEKQTNKQKKINNCQTTDPFITLLSN